MSILHSHTFLSHHKAVFFLHPPSFSSVMALEQAKVRITEIQVRMDCNGCIQKIKKALQGIPGIDDLYIDLPQQKVTIIGRADPEKIAKAIKKTRKNAIICTQPQPTDPPPETTEPASEGGQPALTSANPPAVEAQPPQETQPVEKPKDPPPPENPPTDEKPSSEAADATESKPEQPSKPKDVEEVHIIYRHPLVYRDRYGHGPSYGHHHGGYQNTYPNGPGFRHEPTPPHLYVTHSYNTYKSSPYVTEYGYVRSPPQYTYFSRPGLNGEHYYTGNNGNGNASSMFSDENPNACIII